MKRLFIDIGGTHLRTRFEDGEKISDHAYSSRTTDLADVLTTHMKQHPDTHFIGISFAGQVNEGTILSAPNIALSIKPLKAHFEGLYPNLRLEIENDLTCALLAEADHYNQETIAALYLGTGLGSAFIDQGRLVRGANNLAFELGHIPYKEAPFVCGCGKDNCLELYASGSSLEKWMHHYGIDGPVSFETLGATETGRAIKEQFETALVHAAAILITVANPKLLVLGGGVITRNPYLLDLLKEQLPLAAFAPALERVEIVLSTLEEPGLMGAKLLERDTL